LIAPRFRTIVFDVDSTLSAIEGIDWLASRCSDEVRLHVAATTDRAMRGEIPLATVYGERLAAVAPTREEIEHLAEEYVSHVEADARESLAKLTTAGVRVLLVTAGIRDAVIPLARHVGVSPSEVSAVSVYLDADGKYAGYDVDSPLTRNGGKAEVVRSLGLPHPILAVGDGITDLELKTLSPPAVDSFAAYVGVIDRPQVSTQADYIVRTFSDVVDLVLR
jgi:phosphoserine phosphatase